MKMRLLFVPFCACAHKQLDLIVIAVECSTQYSRSRRNDVHICDSIISVFKDF